MLSENTGAITGPMVIWMAEDGNTTIPTRDFLRSNCCDDAVSDDGLKYRCNWCGKFCRLSVGRGARR